MRVGNKTWIAKRWTQADTMATVGEALATFKQLQREHGLKPEETEGDADGLGIGLIHRLREVGWPLAEFHGNAAAEFSPQHYANRISESWHESIAAIIHQDHIIPNDEEFRGQVLSRISKRNSSGKFMLESKEDMRARGLDSPDEADAVLRAMRPCPQNRSTNLTGNTFDQDDRGWVERGRQERGDYVLPAESCL